MSSISAVHRRIHSPLHRWTRSFGIGGILAVLAFVSPLTQASHTPQGMVEKPRMNAYEVSPAQDAAFSYRGWVDFPGSSGHIEIDVLRRGNGEDESSSWAIDVARATPKDIPNEVDGQKRYRWKTPRIQIFQPQPVPSPGVPENRWPDGGTARVRFRAIFEHSDGTTSQALLPVLDQDKVTGFTDELILADKDPSPANPPGGGPTPNYLNRGIMGSVQETQNYYRQVRTDPMGNGLSIEEEIPTLNAFKARYFGEIPSSCELSVPEVVAKYFNHGDLGLGREMHCMQNSCSKETACYVANFGARDGTPRFNDFAESFEAMKANKPFATVAMVERGKMPFGAPNKVFFVVYDHQKDPGDPPNELGDKAPLDNKGLCKAQGDLCTEVDKEGANIFIPGNCVTCHGSGSRVVSERKPDGLLVKEAYFLPFDLQSFQYYASDPSDPLSRPAQESAFRRLNQIVYFTDLYFNNEANQLINGWYGTFFSRATFQDDFVPQGWTQDNHTQQLYRHVVAPTCRGCHISHSREIFTPSTLRFGTFEDFASFKAIIYDDVCRSHVMPNAEQTLKVLWQSSARPQLLDRMLIRFGCGYELPTSSSTKTALGSSRRFRSAQQVFLDYKTESCACATRECLTAVEEKYVGEFSTIQYDDPSVEEAIATLKSEAFECRQQVLTKDLPLSVGEDERAWEREFEREQVFLPRRD
jgi:hypothetical protein